MTPLGMVLCGWITSTPEMDSSPAQFIIVHQLMYSCLQISSQEYQTNYNKKLKPFFVHLLVSCRPSHHYNQISVIFAYHGFDFISLPFSSLAHQASVTILRFISSDID